MLERAVTDWSVKHLFSRASRHAAGRTKQESPSKSSEEDSSSDEACSGRAAYTKTAIAAALTQTKETGRLDGGAKADAGVLADHDSGGEMGRRRRERPQRAGYPVATTDVRPNAHYSGCSDNRPQHGIVRPSSEPSGATTRVSQPPVPRCTSKWFALPLNPTKTFLPKLIEVWRIMSWFCCLFAHESACSSKIVLTLSTGETSSILVRQATQSLQVVRVYGAPETEDSARTAGWRWDLTLSSRAGDDGAYSLISARKVAGPVLCCSQTFRGMERTGWKVAVSKEGP